MDWSITSSNMQLTLRWRHTPPLVVGLMSVINWSEIVRSGLPGLWVLPWLRPALGPKLSRQERVTCWKVCHANWSQFKGSRGKGRVAHGWGVQHSRRRRLPQRNTRIFPIRVLEYLILLCQCIYVIYRGSICRVFAIHGLVESEEVVHSVGRSCRYICAWINAQW